MKRSKRWILTGILTVSAGYAHVAGGENLLKNATFAAVRDGQPEGWTTTTWAGEAQFSVDPEGRTGSAISIQSRAGADASWDQTVAVPPHARLRLSGWVKTDGVETTTGRGAQLNVHTLTEARTEAVTGTRDWVKVACEFEVQNQESIRVVALFGGWGQATGTAWFDDLTLEVIERIEPGSRVVEAAIGIDPGPRIEPISKYIYGQFIEHLGRCIYGGIWAEMLEDRKFYYPVPAPGDIWRTTGSGARVLADSPWTVIGPRQAVRMSDAAPLSGAHSPLITAAGQPAGIAQGELGVVKGQDYTGRIVLRGEAAAGPVSVTLAWGDGPQDRQTVVIRRLTPEFTTHDLRFSAAADTHEARLEITASGNGSFAIGAVSLMPADNIQGFRRDTLDLMRQLDSPIYRWPGGNFVSGYDWRDGLGERDRRPTRTNPAWTGIEPNDVGMHEFVALCRLLGAEPMITANTGFGDAYSAMAQVEYANGAVDTPMGHLRAENGSAEPLAVEWWCVGNEMWGNWQLGYMRLEHYVLKHNGVEEMMRRADPSIRTVASGNVRGGWSEGMLRHCASHMDYIAEHFYTRHQGDLTAHVRQVPNEIRRKAQAHRDFRRNLRELDGKDIRIAMTEWNYWYGPHVFGELGTRYFMRDALGIAAGLHEYFRQTDIIHSAYYAQTVNVIGCIKTTKTEAGFDATALPLLLYRREFGTRPLAVTGGSDRLDVSAALTEDGEHLTIGLVNATLDTYRVTLDLGGLVPQADAAGWVIAHDDPDAHNHPGEDPVIDIIDLEPADLAQPLTLPPASITVYKVPIRP